MTKALTITALLISTLTLGQVTREKAYRNIKGLTIVDAVSWKDIKSGFYKSDGFGGYKFHLDSNMTFQKIDFDCVARFKVDSGFWTIKDECIVVLKSNKETLTFDIVKFDNFYFFILPTERRKFVTDLERQRRQLKNSKPFVIGNKKITEDYLTGFNLVKKYFAKELDIEDVVINR